MVLDLLFATPASSNVCRVFFSEEPKHVSPLAADDVLLRDNWSLTLVSGPEGTTEPVVEKVLNVVPRSDVSAGAWAADVVVDRRLIQRAEYLVVGGSAISAADGSATLSPDPDDRDQFSGCAELRGMVQRRPREIDRRLDFYFDTFAGTYRITSSNDIAAHGGTDALWKRIVRRVLSSPNGFYHLHDYGAGIQLKKQLDSTRVGELRLNILGQVRREEEVLVARVDVRFESQVLFITIAAKTREDDLTVGMQIQEGREVSVTVT